MPRWPEGPTPRQLEVLRTMFAYQHLHGMPPTMRELADILGISSTNGMNDHLRALQRRGLVRHRPKTARAWLAIQPQEGTTT